MGDLITTTGGEIVNISTELMRVRKELALAEEKYHEAALLLEQWERAFRFPTWLVVVGFLALWPGIIMFVLNKAIFNGKKEKLEKEALQAATEADGIMTQINTVIPQKYLFGACIDYAIELFNTGRANSAPDLYDRLDQQLHRWTLEAQNDQMLASQLAMNQQMGKVSVASGISAAASVINLFR